MNAATISIGQDVLSTIAGVCCDFSGRGDHDISADAKSFCEQWLYEQQSIEVDAAEVQQLIDDCEMSEVEAKRQAAVDAAERAWLATCEWAPENLSFAPIPAFVS